jgi:hypothetical protein
MDCIIFLFLMINHLEKHNSRASAYRGVSKNGPNWQVLFMGYKKKEYLGGIDSELEAARIYD